MEKSKLQKQFEEESGLSWSNQTSIPEGHGYSYECGQWLEAMLTEAQAKAASYDSLVSKTVMSDAELDAPLSQKILREMCEKAEAYDRLMSMNSISENDIQIVLDGNAWCAYRLPFRNLQEDDAGFGATPQIALTALLKSELPDGWEEK